MINNRTSRRFLTAMLPVALGLAALLVGLWFLSRMMIEERNDARLGSQREAQALGETARREWLSFFRANMATTRERIARARANPLSPCLACYLREGDVQRLPPVHGPAMERSSQHLTIDDYIAELLPTAANLAASDTGDAQWALRRKIHAQCTSTTPSSVVDAWVEHQGRVALLARQEIASQFVLFEQCNVPNALSVPLLRDGLQMPGGRYIDGLQVSVLRAAGKLSSTELQSVAQRMRSLAQARNVADADFQRAVLSLGDQPLAALATHPIPESPLIVATTSLQWFVEGTASGLQGFSFATNDVLSQTATTLRAKGILQANESIAAALPRGSPSPEQVHVKVESPRFAAAALRQDRRFAWKLGLVALCGVLAMIVAAFGIALQLNRRRHLEMQSRMIGQVAHEFRTPLASMRAIAETIERRTQSMPEVRDYPSRLLRDIDGMTFLVENTLSFNRLTKGSWRLNPTQVSLLDLMQSAVDDAKELSPRPVVLILPAAATRVTVTGDPELLRLLFRNLVVNAIAYNRHETVNITIDSKLRNGGGLQFLMTDNGVGIERSEWGAVFREYVRGAASPLSRGSGLGLALCQTIMRAHGGDIELTRSDATGTTFGINFS